MSEEYTLDEAGVDYKTDQEKELLEDIKGLSKKFSEADIPCFFCAKFDSDENPTAAWHFGNDEQKALHSFAKDIAPLLLYITSQVTGVEILATNPTTGKTVYQVGPKQQENE